MDTDPVADSAAKLAEARAAKRRTATARERAAKADSEAGTALRAAQQARNNALRDGHEAGRTIAELAKAAGISRARVMEIVGLVSAKKEQP